MVTAYDFLKELTKDFTITPSIGVIVSAMEAYAELKVDERDQFMLDLSDGKLPKKEVKGIEGRIDDMGEMT